MLTRNFYATLFSRMSGRTAEIKIADRSIKAIYDHSTTDASMATTNIFYTFRAGQTNVVNVALPTTTSQYYGYIFGTGNTPASIDDVNIAGDVIPGLSIVQNTTSQNANTSEYVQVLTIQNTTDSTVTIKEVGRVAHGDTTSASNTYSYYSYLLERVVLDAPLTLAPDERGVITLTIEVPTT